MLDKGTVKTGACPLLSVDLSSRVWNIESSRVWIFSRPPSMPCIKGGEKSKNILQKLHVTRKWLQVCVYIYLCSWDHCASLELCQMGQSASLYLLLGTLTLQGEYMTVAISRLNKNLMYVSTLLWCKYFKINISQKILPADFKQLTSFCWELSDFPYFQLHPRNK